MTSQTPWKPGSLWPRLKAQTRHGLSTGALQSIETRAECIEEGGVRFLVRILATLSRKEKARKQQGKTKPANPFLPYEQDLYVTDISPSHVCLLNKFNVVEHHFLIVTREFESQENWLTLADFEALVRCLSEVDGLGFFNGGAIAGASQPHKHLQIVPIEDESFSVPMDTAIRSAKMHQGIGYSAQLPFKHAIAHIEFPALPTQAKPLLAIAQQYNTCYQTLLNAVGIAAQKHGHDRYGEATAREATAREATAREATAREATAREAAASTGTHGQQTAAYNLLCTREWMMVVPRSQERHAEISVNSLGFAGSLLVRNQPTLERLKAIGPMTLLKMVGIANSRMP